MLYMQCQVLLVFEAATGKPPKLQLQGPRQTRQRGMWPLTCNTAQMHGNCSFQTNYVILLLQVILVRDLDARARLPKELQHSNALIMTVAQSKG